MTVLMEELEARSRIADLEQSVGDVRSGETFDRRSEEPEVFWTKLIRRGRSEIVELLREVC
ncbi:MAG TPA: hypothetical protein DHW45_13445 [Candidatus Latescibacteria bacterium]|nr:hypothetical protein [Candidatus Latescibacterota bacterium]